MPADLLAGVEANQSEDDRSAAVLQAEPSIISGAHSSRGNKYPASLFMQRACLLLSTPLSSCGAV